MNGVVVYFILSHTNVPQVGRLVRRIRSQRPQSIVLIHHDAFSEPFDPALVAADDRVWLLDRSIHGEWAHFSLVEIVLYGIEALAQRGIAYDWLVLLSGQDYPVRPLEEFEEALVRSGDGLIETDPAPGTLLDRYRFSWIRFPRRLERGALHRLIGILTRLNGRQPFVRFLSGRVGCRVGIAPRSLPLLPGMELRKGTQWWALSSRAVTFVRTFVEAHPRFVRHFREHTIMPDESFFHTILSNARDLSFVSDDGRFTKWASPSSASPETLRQDDFAAIAASGDYFARKFDTRVDPTILDALDAHGAQAER